MKKILHSVLCVMIGSVLTFVLLLTLGCSGAHPFGDQNTLGLSIVNGYIQDGETDLWIVFNGYAPLNTTYTLEITYPSDVVFESLVDAQGRYPLVDTTVDGLAKSVYQLTTSQKPENLHLYLSNVVQNTFFCKAVLKYNGDNYIVNGEYEGTNGSISPNGGETTAQTANQVRMYAYLRAYGSASGGPKEPGFTNNNEWQTSNLTMSSPQLILSGGTYTLNMSNLTGNQRGALVYPKIVPTPTFQAGTPWTTGEADQGLLRLNLAVDDINSISGATYYPLTERSWYVNKIKAVMQQEMGTASTPSWPLVGTRHYAFRVSRDQLITLGASLATYDVYFIVGLKWDYVAP